MLLMNALNLLLCLEIDTACSNESITKSFHKNLLGKIKIVGKTCPIGNEINNMADGHSKIELHEDIDKV